MNPALSQDWDTLASSPATTPAQLSAKELGYQQRENSVKKRKLEIEKKQIALQRQAEDLDLERHTLANDEQAFALKKEKNRQKESDTTEMPTSRATSRDRPRVGLVAKKAVGRLKAKPGRKPQQRGNSIKTEDDDDDYKGPVKNKRAKSSVLGHGDAIVLTKSGLERLSEGDSIFHGSNN